MTGRAVSRGCAQELCGNWSGDGRVCPCALLGVEGDDRPIECDDPAESLLWAIFGEQPQAGCVCDEDPCICGVFPPSKDRSGSPGGDGETP